MQTVYKHRESGPVDGGVRGCSFDVVVFDSFEEGDFGEASTRIEAVSYGEDERDGGIVSCLDKLSNEEFRIAVEKFISKQQRFLKQQCIVEDDS
ncbi:hypothetical protein L1987_53260 [Smallanthus sonchifolius]|uniref:Uncharacterized protein n=1 Tax=Smallanthus sonchifolius TaxID=185202 RepID=A0ACB9EUW0_9ASTR|nr:hypothetical protein L1987_53260 [Smallanthus sonchifolius]